MGWLFTSGQSRRELIENRTRSWERESGGMLVVSQCLAHCARGNVLWSVWERRYLKDGVQCQPDERWISCDLMQCQRGYGWGYKDMEESCFPYYYSCPLKYLGMVPIAVYGGRADWRECVRSYHEKKKDGV